MDLKKYLLPLLGFLLAGTAAPAVELFDGRGNVTAGTINITTDKLLFSDVSAAAGSRLKNITPATLRTDLDLLTITSAAATYIASGGPANVTELTVTDFISASGLNLAIGDITLGTTITFTDNIRQTFNPGATVAGLNVGSYAGNPSTPTNGDLWYNSTATTLNARINGATVTLGAGVGDAVLGAPASFTELTVTDFIEASGLNLSIGDIALGTTIAYTDNIRQTFNPGATVSGLNVGSYAGNPSTPTNGDIWYNSTATTLNARINGATVALGSGGSFDATAVDAVTWSDGANGSNVWTFDLSGTDPTLTFASGIITVGGNFAITGSFTAASMTVSGALSAGSFEFEGATADAFETTLGVVDPTADNAILLPNASGTVVITGQQTDAFIIAISDETTAHTTGTAKVTFRAPYAFTITSVKGSLTTVSSSGVPTWDINETGTTILSTKLTIDASEKTSTTAATAAVVSDASIAADAEITIDIDTAGTGAAGGKITIIHQH